MGYTAGYNFDVSNLDSDFYKKLSVATPIPDPYATISLSSRADTQIQTALNTLNDLYIDDSVKVVLKFTEINGSKIDARVQPTYHVFQSPVLIDHPVAERLVIEGVAPSDHSIIGVSYYDASKHQLLSVGGNGKFTGTTNAAQDGFYAQLIITNGNSLKIGEYLAIYDNRYQKYLNPSFYQFKDPTNGRVFSTPYPVTAEKLRASLIVGVHAIVDKIDLDERRNAVGNLLNIANPDNKVDYVTVRIKNPNPTYTIGLTEHTFDFARRAYLTPQGIVGRYEQGYGSSTVLEDPLFFSGVSAGLSGNADASSVPGYRNPTDFGYGVKESTFYYTHFSSTNVGTGTVLNNLGHSPISPNRQGLTAMYVDEGSVIPVGNDWERYERLAQLAAVENAVIRNYRDSNDFRAKGFKSIIRCNGDGFIIANNNKPPLLKNILLLSNGSTGHGIRVDNSSSVTLQQVAIVGFSNGAGVFANNKSSVNVIADKFSDPEVFREVGVFSCCNYVGFESRNHSNINAPRSTASGNRFANYYASENSYINAYAAVSTCSSKYGVVAVGKSFINADSAFSCFNGSDGFFCSNGSLLTINSGRACYNYGNGIHAFSSGEVRAFDVISSSNRKDGIVANDSSTIVCGDSSKEPIEWDLYYGYTEPYYNFESPTNISQSRFNGISGLASSTDSFVNASFFETYDNSRIGGEWGRLKSVDCVVSNVNGYCFKGVSAGSICDATYVYCDDARYATTASDDADTIVSNIVPLTSPAPSLCIPYSNTSGLTAQITASPSRYQLIITKLEATNPGGLTIGKILACKGYYPGCGVFNDAADAPGAALPGGSPRGACTPNRTISQILSGATGSAIESFYLNTEAVACTGDTSSLLLNTICTSSAVGYRTPLRPLSLVLPNYDVEIRDSSKIAFAGRVANFGYYDIRTGVRIQPIYRGSSQQSGLLKPSTLIGYSGNKNGSQLVITDQTILETGIFGNQGAASLDPRDARYGVRYSSEDFLSAAELYDPIGQVGYINNTPYILNLGKTDPETGALITSIGATAASIVTTNTSGSPQESMGANDQTSGNGYTTY
jgi:hypothetical protein